MGSGKLAPRIPIQEAHIHDVYDLCAIFYSVRNGWLLDSIPNMCGWVCAAQVDLEAGGDETATKAPVPQEVNHNLHTAVQQGMPSHKPPAFQPAQPFQASTHGTCVGAQASRLLLHLRDITSSGGEAGRSSEAASMHSVEPCRGPHSFGGSNRSSRTPMPDSPSSPPCVNMGDSKSAPNLSVVVRSGKAQSVTFREPLHEPADITPPRGRWVKPELAEALAQARSLKSFSSLSDLQQQLRDARGARSSGVPAPAIRPCIVTGTCRVVSGPKQYVPSTCNVSAPPTCNVRVPPACSDSAAEAVRAVCATAAHTRHAIPHSRTAPIQGATAVPPTRAALRPLRYEASISITGQPMSPCRPSRFHSTGEASSMIGLRARFRTHMVHKPHTAPTCLLSTVWVTSIM